MGGRIAHDAVVGGPAADLELRLDERDDVAADGRVEGGGGRRQHLRERDERDVDDGQAHGFREGAGRQAAGVRPFERDDPRVGAKLFGKLSATHVESIDTGRAALQQHVREPAGRRADVQADEPGRVDPERVERGGELVAAAADVRLRLGHRDRHAAIDEVAGLPVEPGGVAVAHADPPAEEQRLGTCAAGRQPAIDDQLVETDARGTGGDRAHPPIVA